MRVEVITVSNKWPEQDYYCHNEFLKSLAKHGLMPTVLGMGEPWGGLMTKPKTLEKWLKKGNEKRTDCLIVCDSWDLVFAVHPEEIAERWNDGECTWIAGAERSCFPNAALADKHPQSDSSYRYLNSGFIISTPDDMLEVLESMNLDAAPDDHVDLFGTSVHPNDQDYYMRAFLEQPVSMSLDTATEYVWNLCGVDESNFDFTKPIPVNRETGNTPCAFHFNGGAKTDGMMDAVLKHLKLR